MEHIKNFKVTLFSSKINIREDDMIYEYIDCATGLQK